MSSPQFNILIDTYKDSNYYLTTVNNEFTASLEKLLVKDQTKNRLTLIMLFHQCIAEANQSIQNNELTNRIVQHVFNEELAKLDIHSDQPTIIQTMPFVTAYAEGIPIPIKTVATIWNRIAEENFNDEDMQNEQPLFQMGTNPDYQAYHHVLAVPPGTSPKLFSKARVTLDETLIPKIQEDLKKAADIENYEKRRLLTFSLLTQSLAYREIDGLEIEIPDIHEDEQGKMITYRCQQHLIGYGMKTISLTPLDDSESQPGIYVCQGTEIFPSFPSLLGSFLANLGPEGPATEPYQEDQILIKKHLQDLCQGNGPLPIVCGHSLGAALASQIAIHCDDMIAEAIAINPPLAEQNLPSPKLTVIASIDDFAFWRIGSKVVGTVYFVVGCKRWKQLHISLLDILLIVPALTKLIISLFNNFPAHQKILPLMEHYLMVPLTEEMIRKENAERMQRADYIGYFPKLHWPTEKIMKIGRFLFGWDKQAAYNQKELEKKQMQFH